MEKRLQHLVALGNKPGLERISRLLDKMNNPHQNLRYVHVAGTNGKGTTSLIIAGILTASGYKVGRFSSPHLHSYCERFAIDGRDIEPPALEHYLDQVEEHIKLMASCGYEHPTEFEILTAIAFQYFNDQNVDMAVMEVGMGGVYDATNVIIPQASVITSIGYDHMSFLGHTLTEIAFNKAGIIKPDVPVIVGDVDDEARKAIKDQAELKQAEMILSSRYKITAAKRINLSRQIIDIAGPEFNIKGLEFSLAGKYQLLNLAAALTAIGVLRRQGYQISETAIRNCLGQLYIPGRMEIINENPVVIIDAAHNPQGANALAESLQELFPGRKKVLVTGILDDKDRENIIYPLGTDTRICIVTRPEGTRGRNWSDLYHIWRRTFPAVPCLAIENISAAVGQGLKLLEDDDYLVITGSFYILDQARKLFINT